MSSSNTWYFAGNPVSGLKYIALGRRNWYSAFANYLTRQLSTKVYLCDFMDWIDETDPEESLFFFIRTADRIDVNLKDIPKEDLHRATIGAGKSVAKRLELRLPYMTGWEINQVFHRGYLNKTYWHVSDSMTVEEAYSALGHEARSMPPEKIISYYHQSGIRGLENLAKAILKRSWASNLKLYESYGTLLVAVHGHMTRRKTGIIEISLHHENLYIVQVYNADNLVQLWDRNVDTRQLGRMMIELIKKA